MNRIKTGIFILTILFGCFSLKPKTKITGDTHKIYSEYCGGCHGEELQNFRILKSSQKRDLNYITNIIKEGNEINGMPAFGLSFDSTTIANLSNYIFGYDYSVNQISETDSSTDYAVDLVVGNLEIPWGMDFLPNGNILITEKKGKLSSYSIEQGLNEITGLPPIRTNGQGGLLDILVDPEYEKNGWIYFTYSYIDKIEKSNGNTALMRAKIQGNELVNQEILYQGMPAVSKNVHFGSRIAMDSSRYLYFSNGERGMRDQFPQSVLNTNGKIHRIHANGNIPADNPFVDKNGAIPSIWSYGHRNPQGLVIHPKTGQLWEHEHGPKGGDEINIIEPGKNYGWPVISYGLNYSGSQFTDITEKDGMEQPIHYYVPSIAPCGMTFINSNKYEGWENNLLIGSLKFRYLERLELFGNIVLKQEKLLEELNSRVRNVKMGPDGYIYVALEDPGRIIKIIPN